MFLSLSYCLDWKAIITLEEKSLLHLWKPTCTLEALSTWAAHEGEDQVKDSKPSNQPFFTPLGKADRQQLLSF